jgi:hypothetical protein
MPQTSATTAKATALTVYKDRNLPRRRGLLGPLLLATLVVLVALPLALVLWLATADWVPPERSLPRPAVDAVAESGLMVVENGREISQWRLHDRNVGEVGFVLDRPAAPAAAPSVDGGKRPAMILLGGAPKGEQALAYMPPLGENIVISLDWPMPVPGRMPRGLDIIPAAPSLRHDILSAPGQVAAAYFWLTAQPDVDPERISLIGVSLGALVAPAAQYLIEQESGREHPVAATLLAFGGSGLGALVAANPLLSEAPLFAGRPWALELLGWVTDHALYPVEPAHYLPRIGGRFMVINASADTVIPQTSAARFTELTPDPKDVLRIAGGHIGPDPETPRILRSLTGIATGWLTGIGAVNPP